jgi:hypothetical protein
MAVRFGERLGGWTVLSTHPGRTGYAVSDRIDLGADEAVIIAVEHAASATGPDAKR